MNILFADSIDASGTDRLKELGHHVVVDPSVTAADLPQHLEGVDILVVRSTKVTAQAISAGGRLGLIVRAGAGTDNIDSVAASNNGIYVCNVPGRNAVAVAELTMGLLLAVDRRIGDNVADLRAKRWEKGKYSKGDGLMGRRLAIIGLGDIGLAVAERAVAFGMQVSTLDRPRRSPITADRINELGIETVATRRELLSQADAVSIHVPKAPDTIGMADAEFFAEMKPGSILLNTSRGDVVDSAALLSALDDRGIRAGLDVWPNEPKGKSGSFDSALAQHPQVVGTHHIGASTHQAQESVAEGTMEVIEGFLSGVVVNCVNLDPNAIGTSCVVIRHLDRVGVLAQIFTALRGKGHNVQQMNNQVFDGAEAAVATIHIKGDPGPTLIEEIEAIDEVMAVSVINPLPPVPASP